METVNVENSSNIRAIAYEGSSLFVTFNTNAQYRYDSVPESVWNDFKAAPSKGAFFAANVKGQYQSQKV